MKIFKIEMRNMIEAQRNFNLFPFQIGLKDGVRVSIQRKLVHLNRDKIKTDGNVKWWSLREILWMMRNFYESFRKVSHLEFECSRDAY